MVNTTVWMPAPADEDRGVRGIDLFVRSDAYQLALIDRGELSVDVAARAVDRTAAGRRHGGQLGPRHRRGPRLLLLSPERYEDAGIVPLNPVCLRCFPPWL
ncbi:hypothetical protein [Streptomyces tendae]|uniref:hypothetical protein n=1 Tax=Streptomyces tendae TaxID=1932 RepID=UPI003EB88E90